MEPEHLRAAERSGLRYPSDLAIDDDDVGFGERRRWWRRRVAQRGSATYRVIDSDRQELLIFARMLWRALSPTFPAGEMVFFIPWRVVAEESGAAHLDLPGLAGGAVADSILVIFRFGATMELGRLERTTMRPLWSYRVDGVDSPDGKPR